MNHHIVGALAICFGGALLEALCAGLGVKQRLADLRWPSFSPSPWAWYAIGVIYYLVVFVSAYKILECPPTLSLRNTALALLIVVVALNAIWNLLFFRAKNLKATFFFSLSYSVVAIVLWYCLIRLDSVASSVFGVYATYLIYANLWGYRVWQVNR